MKVELKRYAKAEKNLYNPGDNKRGTRIWVDEILKVVTKSY